MIAAAGGDGLVLVELGAVFVGLAALARLSGRFALTPIPLYLVAGLVFGEGGVAPLALSEEFIGLGSQIGVVLLLLTLGLAFTPEELAGSLAGGLRPGLLDAVLNFTPGVLAGLVLGWDASAAVLLGGVTYISSSGVVAKVLGDLGRMGNRETPPVLALLVLEDLAMAVYLPVVAVVLAPDDVAGAALSFAVTAVVVVAVVVLAFRHGTALSRLVAAPSDEALLLGVLGATLLTAGLAEEFRLSAAVGAFLVGLVLSGPVSARAMVLVGPLRDLFAATFFFFFGLQLDPGDIPDVLVPAAALAVVTAAAKYVTGWWTAGRAGVGRAGRARAGAVLIARGEFSIVIAELGVAAAVEPRLGALAATYVLLLAVAGPVLARAA